MSVALDSRDEIMTEDARFALGSRLHDVALRQPQGVR
jgi:hypothetical protein